MNFEQGVSDSEFVCLDSEIARMTTNDQALFGSAGFAFLCSDLISQPTLIS